MTVSTFLRTLWRRWLVVAAVTLLCAGAAVALGYLKTPVYRTSATQYFTLNYGKTASDLSQGATYTSTQMTSFATLVTSPVVLQPVIDDLGLKVTAIELARSVTATTPRDTAILTITVKATDPKLAADIANAIAAQSKIICEKYSPATPDGAPSVLVYTISPAVAPQFQYAPNKRINLLLGLVGGFLLGSVLAVLRELLDTRLRTATQVEQGSTASVLASLSQRTIDPGSEVVTHRDDIASEEFRQLRAGFQYAVVGQRPFATVVSSPTEGDGKTTVSVNLAVALAQGSDRVLLIDADLRRPRVAAATSLDSAIGLTDVLVRRVQLADAVQRLDEYNLDVLVSGETPPNPGELVGSAAMRDIITTSKEHYDLVIIDAAPVLPVADGALLAQLTDGYLVVINARRTRRPQLNRALARLAVSHGRNLGVVLNRVAKSQHQSYTYVTAKSPSGEAHAPASGQPAPGMGPVVEERSAGTRVSARHGED